MRIAIDLSQANFAGIDSVGLNPCVGLARAVIAVANEHTVFVILSDEDPDLFFALRSVFLEALPARQIRSWHRPAHGEVNSHGKWSIAAAGLLKNGLLADLAVTLVVMPTIETGATEEPTVVDINAQAVTTLAVAPAPEENLNAQARSLLARFGGGRAARSSPTDQSVGIRRKLAFVSPLPPERSGIADYSAQLLPALAELYEIDVIIDQAELNGSWVRDHCGVRSVQWLIDHAHTYDRVMYHVGNSSYHRHMFELLRQVPGVVVLHDFFLGDIYNYLDVHGLKPHALPLALYESHGYAALNDLASARDVSAVISRYPANLGVVERSLGMIVHSDHARQLAKSWYGHHLSHYWQVVSLPRARTQGLDRQRARQKLGLGQDEFIVCSFGLMGPNKLNDRLLDAWLLTPMAQDGRCQLIFVGESHDGTYGAAVTARISSGGMTARIRITGWTDGEDFQNYLAAADLAVQLRANSRGETSAAVLDCMNHGLATLVNAHGAFAELPVDSVLMLPEDFADSDLAEAMTTLWRDPVGRAALGERARQFVAHTHAPETCARAYANAIEKAYTTLGSSERNLVQALAKLDGHIPSDSEYLRLAKAIVQTKSCNRACRQLLVDISATARQDLKTGIQRVVRALVKELISKPPEGFRVEPVYLTERGGAWHYRYAREWTSRALGLPEGIIRDEPIDYWAGDVMLVADFTSGYAVEAEKAGVFAALAQQSVSMHFCVYDLLPILRPEFFPPGQFGFVDWIKTVARSADGIICISRSVAEDVAAWMAESGVSRMRPISISWFHLGADIENSVPSKGLPNNAEKVLGRIKARPSFLMVGTIEPRKGYLQTVDAFSLLWQAGQDVNLVIVGREGWRGLPDDCRRTIPNTMTCLRDHAELGRRLIWLEDASDEYLECAYAASTCLIAASECEGFGLPLIEAAQRKIPILARDIPVFREVAGKHAHFFDGLEPTDLANAVMDWLKLHASGDAPTSANMPWLTWRQSTDMMLTRLNLNG